MDTGGRVTARPQFAVRQVLQGLRQQGLRAVGAYGGQRPHTGPAGGVDVADDEGGDARPQQGRGVAGAPVRIEAAAQQCVPLVRTSAEHGAHARAEVVERRLGAMTGDPVHGAHVSGHVAGEPGGLRRPEQGADGARPVVRREQSGGGEQCFPGVGDRPVAQRDQPAYIVGAAGRGFRAYPGQQRAGASRIPGEPGVLGGRCVSLAAQGLVGGQGGGPGEGRGAVGVRAGRTGRARQGLGEGGVVPAGRAGALDQSRQRPVRSVEHRGEQAVHGAAAGGRGAAQQGPAQQRLGEVDPFAVDPYRAQRLGRSEPAGVDPGESSGPQQDGRVGAGAFGFVFLGRRREQQQEAGVVGQGVDVRGVGVQQALAAAQGVRQPAAARELVLGQPGGERGEQPGVARGLAQEFLPYAGIGPAAGQPVEQFVGRGPVERSEAERGQRGEVPREVPCPVVLFGGREQYGDRAAGGRAADRVDERGSGRAVPGVRVVHAEQQGARRADGRQEGRQPGGAGGRGRRGRRRAQEGVQPAVGQQAFGRCGGRVQQDRLRARAVHGVAQERGAAEPRRPGQDEGAAAACPQPGQQLCQDGEFTAAAVQPERTANGRRWGHVRHVTAA